MTPRTGLAPHRACFAAWLATLCLAGCGGGSKDAAPGPAKPPTAGAGAQSQANQQIAQGAKQVAEGAKQMARGVTQLVQAAAKPIEMDALKELLPEVGGWKKVNPEGEMISSPVPYSLAHARYTKDASTVELEIKDSALSQVILGPATMFMSSGFEEKSDDGHKKTVTVAGSPGFENWNRTAHAADVIVIVANRFVVTASGKNVDSVEPVRAVLQAVSFQKLARLK